MIVADNGVGIPDELAGNLFQPFVTGNRARTTGKGTGLGLSITHRIVVMHQGTIELVNPPHKPYRTEFRILLKKQNKMGYPGILKKVPGFSLQILRFPEDEIKMKVL